MKERLRQLIAEGKTNQALDELRLATANDADLTNEVTLLSSRFENIQRQRRLGLSDRSDIQMELNKINDALLAIIGKLGKTPPSVSTPLLSQTRLIWLGGGLIALIGILANLTTILDYLGLKPTESGKEINVAVNVADKEGKLIPNLNNNGAYVVMTTSGGGAPQELIDDKGKANFTNIKVGDKVRLKINFSEPYHPLKDTFYTVPADGRIDLVVGLENQDRVSGRVFYKEKPLPGVIVSIDDLRATTDDLGFYKIKIPEAMQRKKQTVYFNKTGFKTLIKNTFPQTDTPLDVVMEK
jgi:hypothetical protein